MIIQGWPQSAAKWTVYFGSRLFPGSAKSRIPTSVNLVHMRNIETSRLILRPLTNADLDELHRLYGDGRVMQYITGRPRSRQETAERLAAHIKQHDEFDFGLCAVIDRESWKFVGRCGLEPRSEKGGIAGDLAWMLAPVHWGRGLGSETGQALVDFGLNELGLHRVYATADQQNLASIAIMKKLGMDLVREDARGVEYEIRR